MTTDGHGSQLALSRQTASSVLILFHPCSSVFQ